MNDGYGNGNGNNLAEEEVADKGEEDAKRDGELLDRHLRQQDANTPCMRPSSAGRGQAGLPVPTWGHHVLGMCVGVGAGVSATPTCKHCACPCRGVGVCGQAHRSSTKHTNPESVAATRNWETAPHSSEGGGELGFCTHEDTPPRRGRHLRIVPCTLHTLSKAHEAQHVEGGLRSTTRAAQRVVAPLRRGVSGGRRRTRVALHLRGAVRRATLSAGQRQGHACSEDASMRVRRDGAEQPRALPCFRGSRKKKREGWEAKSAKRRTQTSVRTRMVPGADEHIRTGGPCTRGCRSRCRRRSGRRTACPCLQEKTTARPTV